MGEDILPIFLKGDNGKKALWGLIGIVVLLLLIWGVVSIFRTNNSYSKSPPVVVDPQGQQQGQQQGQPQAGGSNWNDTAEGQKNARDVAQKIFNHLKNGWTFGGWVCSSPRIIPGIIEALSKSSDKYVLNVGRFYGEIDDTKLSELFSNTPCQIGLGRGIKKSLIARLKTLGL